MHRAAPLLATIIMAAAPTVAGAWADPAGDHQVGLDVLIGVQVDDMTIDDPEAWFPGGPSGWFPYIDVTDINLEETETDLLYSVAVADTAAGGNDPQEFSDVSYRLRFDWHGAQHALSIRDIRANGQAWANLERPEIDAVWGDVRWRPVATGVVEEDASGWTARFEKEDLRDEDLVPMRRGDLLSDLNFTVDARMWARYQVCAMAPPDDTNSGCFRARDHGPMDMGDFPIELAPPTVGHLLLDAPSPLRASNGLATTYLYELRLRDLGGDGDQVTMHALDVPAGWNVHFPPLIDLPAGGDLTVPIAVSVPFRHAHGEEAAVRIEARSERVKGIYDDVQIGVVWTDIPQPGGHHPRLHLHADANGGGWMNTLEEDADARGDAITRKSYSARYAENRADYDMRFNIALSPRLALGMDFDLERSVTGTYDLRSPVTTDAQIGHRLLLRDGSWEETLLAEEALAPFAMRAGEEEEVQIEMGLLEAADRVPYAPGSSLFLEAHIVYHQDTSFFEGPTDEHPAILTAGASIHLPLLDYHDIIDEEVLSSLTRLRIEADGQTARELNAGRTAAFVFHVTNSDDRGDALEWTVEGEHAEWATVSPETGHVPAGEAVPIVVAVAAPDTARPGDAADVLVIGKSQRDGAQLFARISATVTDSVDIPDEAELAARLRGEAEAAGAKEAPIPAVLVLAALAFALAHRRFER